MLKIGKAGNYKSEFYSVKFVISDAVYFSCRKSESKVRGFGCCILYMPINNCQIVKLAVILMLSFLMNTNAMGWP